jgi:tetratricopeptide (TPR) repeat protein
MKCRRLFAIFSQLVFAIGFTLCLAESGVAGAPPTRTDATSLALEGRHLSQQQAQQLEEALKSAPDDLSIRTKLIGYYWGQFRSTVARQVHQQHVLWVIKNHPEAEISGLPECTLNPHLDDGAYKEAEALWKQQVDHHPADPAVLRNAAAFFLLQDATFAEGLLKKGEALESTNPLWPERLGQLYSLEVQTACESDVPLRAAKALAAYERAYGLTARDLQRTYLLSDLATAAFDAGALEKAKSYAALAIDAAKRWPSDWNAGNDIHHGNLILGRVALREGDVEKAKRFLILAGKTHGSPQLNSFGPNMVLAKDLLERGERTAVLKYLSLCGRFWSSGQTTLHDWTATIKAGGTPDFGANLFY